MMAELVKFTVESGVGVITVDNPPVNALSAGVPEGIAAGIERAAHDASVCAVVLIGAGQTFVAGADIKQLEEQAHGRGPGAPNLHRLLKSIERGLPQTCRRSHLRHGPRGRVAGGPHHRTREKKERLGSPESNAAILAAGREQARKTCRIMIAPLRVIDAVEAAVTLPFEEGCRREREIVEQCLAGDEARALIHAFFAERAVSKVRGISKETGTYSIRKAGVIGAGTMGGGIAMVLANAGIPVLLKETDQATLDRGLASVRKNYESSVKKGRLTAQEVEERLALIQPQLTYDGFGDADIVIEAVFENMSLKKQVFGEIDRIAKGDCVLVGNCRGFIGNRMMLPYMREAQLLVEEGTTPSQVDQALYDFGIMINEGARILAEELAQRAADIDTIYITGYSFPAYRGGPMWYADTIGLPKIHERILEFRRQYGEYWTTAPLLERLVRDGQTFAAFDAANE